MTKYLQEKQHYIDRYDKITIEDCRWRENFHKNYKYKGEINGKEVTENEVGGISGIALHFDLLYTTIKWYEDKEKTISEWMESDRKKDELYENAVPPRDVYCLKCNSLTSLKDKMLYDHNHEEDRILFMFECPKGCLPHRGIYENGEEYKIKPNLCPKCNSILERKHERVEDKKIITTDICPQCGYKDVDEYELSKEKEEKPDPDYEKDRERFCLSGKRLADNLEEKRQIDGIGEMVDRWKEKEEHKEDYEAVNNLKKLTITELEEIIKEATEKEGYINLRFNNPEMSKDVIVPFIINDNKPERKDRVSSLGLERIIKTTLQDTSWRLMSEGISYRLGILTGRLRAYEREEDLLGLVRQKKS